MGAGKIIGGIVLLIIGIIIFGFSNGIHSIQTQNIQQCNTFTGRLGQSLSQQQADICSTAPAYQSFSATGIFLGVILAVIGVALVIIGAISGRRKKEYTQPKQQHDSPQDRTRSLIQSVAPSKGQGRPNPVAENKNIGLETDLKELERLGDLKQKGTITEEEFQKLKSQVLGSPPNVRQQEQQSSSIINEEKEQGKRPFDIPFDIYWDSRVGIKIKYPLEWKVRKKDDYYPDHRDERWSQVVGFNSPDEIKLENVAVYVKELPFPMTIYEYANQQLSRLKNSITESSQAVVAGNQAHRVQYRSYKGSLGSDELEVLEVWTVKTNKLYTIRCMTKPQDFSGYLPIFQNMIDSIEMA